MKKIINDEGRTCTTCSNFLTWTKYSKAKKGTRGYRSKCDKCYKEYTKALSLDQRNKTSKMFEHLYKQINPNNNEPYKRGDIYGDMFVWEHVSKTSIRHDWDKPYFPLNLVNFDEFVERYSQATIQRRNEYVKNGRIESHSLTRQHLVDIFPRDMMCPIFNIKMTLVSAQMNSVQLDRVDRKYNYRDGNVAWISAQANRCKSDATSEELYKIADWLSAQGL